MNKEDYTDAILRLVHTGLPIPVPKNNPFGIPYAHNYRAHWQLIADELQREGRYQDAAKYQANADYWALYDSTTPPSLEMQKWIESIQSRN